MKSFEIIGSILEHEIAPTVMWAGIPLYDLPTSEKLIACCKKHGIGILGIDGFTREGTKRRARLDLIADFSASYAKLEDFNEKSIGFSRRFLELAKDEPGLLFEFVLVS